MSGGYDLYGNYYPRMADALNAEMVQCNEIDNRINQQKIETLERRLYEKGQQQQPSSNEEEIHWLWEKVKQMEERIIKLEQQ